MSSLRKGLMGLKPGFSVYLSPSFRAGIVERANNIGGLTPCRSGLIIAIPKMNVRWILVLFLIEWFQ